MQLGVGLGIFGGFFEVFALLFLGNTVQDIDTQTLFVRVCPPFFCTIRQ